MKKLFVILLLTTTLVSAQKNFLDIPYIEVTGTVESEIVPDRIYLSITINENDKKGKLSVEAQETEMIRRLKAGGIDTDKNLSVESFSSDYSTFFFRKDDALKIKRYSLLLSNTQQLDKAFRVFDELEISNVYVNKIDHSKMEEFKLEAKVKAIQVAKKKAMAYAEAIGQKVGKALFVTESSNTVANQLAGRASGLNSNIPIRGASSIYGSRTNEFQNSLDFQKITIAASVEAKFELQ